MSNWTSRIWENAIVERFASAVLHGGKSLLHHALETVARWPEKEKPGPEAIQQAVAAAEMIAAAKGKPSAEMPERIRLWIRQHNILKISSPWAAFFRNRLDLITLARLAVRRIKSASELREMIQGSALTDLLRRLDDLEARLA